MNVLITLTSAGTDTGPFNLYCNSDNYIATLATGISREVALAGYLCTTVPNNATIIRVQSLGTCGNYVDLAISFPATTTTTTTIAPPITTTTTTTANPTTTTTTTGSVPPTTTTTTTGGGGGGTTTTTTTSGGGGTTTTTTSTSSSTTTTTTTSAVKVTYTMALVNNALDCTTNAPTQVWSYLVFPFGYYFINGNSTDKYFIQPATHTNYTTQITSKVNSTCTPVPKYTYLAQALVNGTTCEIDLGDNMWSYNVIANGWYYINGNNTQKYYITSASHTTYTSQISSSTSTAACVPSSCTLYRVVNNDSTDATVYYYPCGSNILTSDTVFANSNLPLPCAKTGSVTCTATSYTVDPLDNCT